MSTGRTPTTPIENDGNSQPPRMNLNPATTASSNHYPDYPDCPGCLAEEEAAVDQHPPSTLETCPGCPDCLPKLSPFPLVCEDPDCPDRRPRLPHFPAVCGDLTCSQCNRLAVSSCQCASCLGLMSPFDIGLGRQQQSMAERDRILAENTHFMAEENNRKEKPRIAGERSTRPKSAALIMALEKAMEEGEHLENAMARLGLYPPSDSRHRGNQERRTSTAVPTQLSATSDTERNAHGMAMKKGETSFCTNGSMCACGDSTSPGGMGTGPTQQSVANTRRFEEMVATRGLPGGMFPPGLYPPPIGEVRGPTTMWPGFMFAPTSAPMVPMSPPGLPGPNNMWPGRMFAPPSVPVVPIISRDMPGPSSMWSGRMFAPMGSPMVRLPAPNTPGPNNMWRDRILSPRGAPVSEQRQAEIDMQRNDEALRDARRDHDRADECLTYLQRELAKEEQQVATLKAETQRMMGEGLESEEKIVKLGQKFFLQLDAEDQVKATKQELAVARSHLVAAEMACEEAGHEHQRFERHENAGGHGGVKDSEGKGKGVATNAIRQQFEEHESEITPGAPLDDGRPHPVESEGSRICHDCGGLKEDGQDDEEAEEETHTTI